MNTRLTRFVPSLLVVCGLAGPVNGPAVAGDAWQERLLLDPPASQLRQEARGRVMIYDGLTDARIEQAMDTQFERIDSMMFVRTIVTDDNGAILRDEDTGSAVVEDDGC